MIAIHNAEGNNVKRIIPPIKYFISVLFFRHILARTENPTAGKRFFTTINPVVWGILIAFVKYFRGRHLVLLNKSETRYDDIAEITIHDDIKNVIEELEK